MITIMDRTATWNNLGTDITKATTVQEILNTSDLNYTVEKRPLYITGPNNENLIVPGKSATVRTDTNQVLGVVSNKYNICQNEDAFNFIDSVAVDTEIKFQKAGTTSTGLIYIIGQLPEVQVLGDTFTPHLIFQTSHNGLSTIRTTICPLRMVCQNQFSMSFKDSPNTVSIQHSGLQQVRLKQASDLLKSTVNYMEVFKDNAESLAALKLGDDNSIKNIINGFFKSAKEQIDFTEKQQTLLEEKTNALFAAYKSEDNQNFQGTAWGLLNGFTDYTTHSISKKQMPKEDSKFLKVTFDPIIIQKFTNYITTKA